MSNYIFGVEYYELPLPYLHKEFWMSKYKQYTFEFCNLAYLVSLIGVRTHSIETKNKLKDARLRKIKLDGPTVLKGELNGRSKLDEVKVLNIRRLKEIGYSYNRLAMKYNVSKTTIIGIIKRRKWNHI